MCAKSKQWAILSLLIGFLAATGLMSSPALSYDGELFVVCGLNPLRRQFPLTQKLRLNALSGNFAPLGQDTPPQGHGSLLVIGAGGRLMCCLISKHLMGETIPQVGCLRNTSAPFAIRGAHSVYLCICSCDKS